MAAKKLLLVISSLCKGGSERVLSILANGFVEKGYEVTLVTFTSNEISYPLHPAIKVVCLYRPFHSFNLMNRVRWFFQVLSGIKKWSVREKYDAIISFGQNTNIKVILANLFLNNKIIISDRCDPNYFSNRYEILVRNILYRFAKYIVVQTHEIKEEQYIHFKNVKVIYNPLINHNIRAELKNRTIITVGRLDAAKNHEFLIRNVKDILPDKWQFYIIGDGPLKNELQNFISRNDLNNKIKLLGKVDDVYERIAAASIFIYASESEGYPNAIIEAMSVGLPVVSSNCKYGPNEIIENNKSGFLYDLNDPWTFKNKVLQLLNNDELRKEIGIAAIKIKAKTNERTIIDQWLSLID